MAKQASHRHAFSAKGDRAYIFTMHAPKTPSEASEGKAIPAFLIAFPEEKTLNDLHHYICSLLDRKIKGFYFRVAKAKDKHAHDANNDQENYTYYVPEHMLEENPAFRDANIQLRITALKEHDTLEYKLNVTGSEWQKIVLLSIMPCEAGQEYPTSSRLLIRIKKQVDANGKEIFEDIPLKSKENRDISEAQEEKYVAEMHKTMHHVAPMSLESSIFMFSCISVMEYVRLHKLINFSSQESRTAWTASIMYTAAVINEHDPEFPKAQIDKETLATYFKVPKETILQNHAATLNCLQEENIDLDTLTMQAMRNMPIFKNQIDLFAQFFNTKTPKIHQFKKK
ncbi:MAG: hypothetical protein IJU79_05630 [Desulfovibrionaceae bacterium]|nr:hypothetical protein [Desulfovibrionaceae bacterium]